MSETYDLYRQGQEHLARGRAAQATVALEKAKKREPEKASIREALGIATSGSRFSEAETGEREIQLQPVDHYAHFALGRCPRSRASPTRPSATTARRASSAAERGLRRALETSKPPVASGRPAGFGGARGRRRRGGGRDRRRPLLLLGVEEDGEGCPTPPGRLGSSRTIWANSTSVLTPAAGHSSSASSPDRDARQKGTRPDFNKAARPGQAEPLYGIVRRAPRPQRPSADGVFSPMQVSSSATGRSVSCSRPKAAPRGRHDGRPAPAGRARQRAAAALPASAYDRQKRAPRPRGQVALNVLRHRSEPADEPRTLPAGPGGFQAIARRLG
jgi:hypothetical protein